MKIARLFIITLLLAGSLPAQGEFKQETYWIYTYSNELKAVSYTHLRAHET